MADTTVKISLELANEAANKALDGFIGKSQTADKAIQDLGEHGKSTFAEITAHISQTTGAYEIFAGNVAANVAIKALELLAEAAKELFDVFVVEGVKAASEYEDSLNLLNVALAGNGNYTKEASKGFENYAASIQATTKYSDDAVLKNLALLESIGRLDKEGLQRASDSAINLASALHIDLEAAFQLVAKAAEGNTTALQKHGIQVEQGANAAETFANVLEQLEGRFGGAAQGAVNTYAGAVAQATHAFEDFQKEVGFTITQNPVVIAAIKEISQQFLSLASSANGSNQALKTVVAESLILFIGVSEAVIFSIDAIVKAFNLTYNLLAQPINALGALLVSPFVPFSKTAKDAFDQFIRQAADASTAVVDTFTKDSGLTKIARGLDDVRLKAQAAFGDIGNAAATTVEPVNKTTAAIHDTTEELTLAEKAAKELADTLLKQAGSAKVAYEAGTKALEESLKNQDAAIKLSLNQRKINGQQAIDQEKLATDKNFADRLSLLNQENERQKDQLDEALLTDEEYNVARLQLEKDFTDQKNELGQKQLEANTKIADSQVQNDNMVYQSRVQTLGNLSNLTRSKNKELFEIGKIASMAKIAQETYTGAISAYSSLASIPYVGPALGIAAAAALTAYGVEQEAALAATSPAFEDGGIVGGTSFSGDKITARVNSGEMILNSQQQASLFKMANGSSDGSSNQIAALAASVAQLAAQPIQVAIDGSVIFEATRTQLKAGKRF